MLSKTTEHVADAEMRNGEGGGLPSHASYRRLVPAAMLALASLYGAHVYGYHAAALLIGLVCYAAIISWRPYSWLLLLPPIMAWVNLSPWSGSFFLEEFDLFIPMTAAVLIVRNAYGLRGGSLSKLGWLGLSLYSISWFIALLKGLFPLAVLDANTFSSYYSHYNALRIAKSYIWGIMLWPAVSHAYRCARAETVRFFSWGMAVAVLGVGLIALWERGFFTELLYSHNLHAIVYKFLDFTTHYRITGLFAEMHTGGEAIDGFLALSLPFALYAAFHGGSRLAWLLGSLAAILGFYAATVTFSRTTYLAASVVVATLGVIAVFTNERSAGKSLIFPFVGIVAAFSLLAFEYKRGGGLLLLSGVMGCSGAIVAGFLFRQFRYGRALQFAAFVAWALLALLVMYGSARGILANKWVHTGVFQGVLYAIAMSVVASFSGAWLGMKLAGNMSMKKLLVTTVLCMGVGATMIHAFFGTRMEQRFSESTEDFGTRWNHWIKSIRVMDDDVSSYLLGMGLGRYPSVYFWRYAANGVGMYRFVKEGGNQYLVLRSGPDLKYGQRIALDAYKKYTFSFDVRTHDPSLDLRIRICRRNIIEPYDWNPECIKFTPDVMHKEGKWRHYVWAFDIGNLGDGYRIGRKPLMLEMSNLRVYDYTKLPPTLVDIDNVSIKDQHGNEYVRNGDFGRGWRGWYPYFDIYHLPWHAKNFWVALFFGQGALGSAGMIIMMFAALRNGKRRLRERESFTPYLLAALAGFIAVGLFGTLVDVPRIMTLFYIVLFSLLVLPRTQDYSAASVRTTLS